MSNVARSNVSLNVHGDACAGPCTITGAEYGGCWDPMELSDMDR